MRDAEDEFEEGFDDEYAALDPCADCGFYHQSAIWKGALVAGASARLRLHGVSRRRVVPPEDQRDIFPRTSSIAWQDAVRERIERKQLAEVAAAMSKTLTEYERKVKRDAALKPLPDAALWVEASDCAEGGHPSSKGQAVCRMRSKSASQRKIRHDPTTTR